MVADRPWSVMYCTLHMLSDMNPAGSWDTTAAPAKNTPRRLTPLPTNQNPNQGIRLGRHRLRTTVYDPLR